MDIGFIGVGKMGGAMVANLLKGGQRVWVYDIDPGAMARAVELGASPCHCPREASQGRQAVFLSLMQTHTVEEVVLGPEGVLSASPVPPLLIDTSTLLPTASQRIAAAALEKGCQMLDAPVSGRVRGAVEGTLSVMVGGPPEAFEKALPLLRLIGKQVHRVGEVGTGNTMKIVNNLIIGITKTAIAEAMMLGTLSGIDPKTIYEVVSTSTGNSGTFQDMGPRVLKGDFEAGGAVESHLKVSKAACQLGQELGLPMPVANAARELYQAAESAGWGEKDGTVVITLLERLMGVEARDRSAT